MYDFDKEINRYNTNSLKYDYKKERGVPEDVIPLWVADMDFETAKEIKEALANKAMYGIFGYSEPTKSYFEAFNRWFLKYHGWSIEAKEIVLTCGVVQALATAVNILTSESDYVLINNPVYYPFTSVIVDNKRKLVSSDLINNSGRYEIDFNDFEKKIIKNNVKLYILCSPHNPVGRVWTKNELEKIVDICKKHKVFIVSDEIHCDFTYNDNKHYSLAHYKDYLDNIIVCTSATKTFNLAGLQVSNIYIKNDIIRNRFKIELDSKGFSQANIMGIVATEAAYTYGDTWLKELKEYLYNNYLYVSDYINNYLPKIKVTPLEGTYLVWLDFKDLGLNEKELKDFMLNKAHLWTDLGYIFGESGKGFVRINIACPKSILKEALDNLFKAYQEL